MWNALVTHLMVQSENTSRGVDLEGPFDTFLLCGASRVTSPTEMAAWSLLNDFGLEKYPECFLARAKTQQMWLVTMGLLFEACAKR